MKKLLVISGLSLALLSGTAFAQVSVGGSGGLDANVGIGSNGANAEAGANASGNVDADDNGNAGANVGTGATVTAEGDDGELNADADATANAAGDVDSDDIDSEATASVDASVDAALDSIGDGSSGFFTDDTRAEINSQEEISSTFAGLTADQQNSLREACGEGGSAASSSANGRLCAAINAM